ncbi:MAG: hypothetical protein IJS47_02855, partial [Clostridia bacterium]|nr:hypothetical protein [Clostridia bacterium]
NSSSSLQDGAKYIIGKMVDSDGELVDNDSSVVNCVGMQYTNNSRAVWVCSGNDSDGYTLKNEQTYAWLTYYSGLTATNSYYGSYCVSCTCDSYGRLVITHYNYVVGYIYKEVN